MINYHYFETLPSTQTHVKEHIDEFDLSEVTCIYTGSQTGGLGTRGKKWYSPAAGNIYATFLFQIPTNLKHTHNLAQIVSLSVAKTIVNHNLKPTLRWPNDLMLNRKKFGGVLVEIEPGEKNHTVILGLGVNVNMQEEDLALLDQPATSLAHELENPLNEKELLCQIGDQFLVDLETYENDGFAPFYDLYTKLMDYTGSPIAFKEARKTIRGHVDAIHPDGRLVVLLPDGTTTLVSSGTLSNLG